jgi:hypothetical protein
MTDLSPAFWNAKTVARRLGWESVTSFKRHLPRLRRAGFPEPNAVLGMYLVADVETWIARQRKLTDSESEPVEVNYGAL